MTTRPPDEILERFGIRVVAPLGGRLNQHWLVQSGGADLVLRRCSTFRSDVAYELRLLEAVAALGWPVAPAVAEPIEREGHLWCLFAYLPGEPPSVEDPLAEQRTRGRLLAEFHADLARLGAFGQRAPWRRCEEILEDPTLDPLLAANERARPEDVRVLRWHLERARARVAGLALAARSGIVVHGDFTAWNLRYLNGRLSGILDFELSHWDHRVGDFALSWRGRYDAVVHAYAEVAPLEDEEWALLTPVWWSLLIDGACRHLAEGTWDDGWNVQSLLRRSPLMGPDAAEFR